MADVEGESVESGMSELDLGSAEDCKDSSRTDNNNETSEAGETAAVDNGEAQNALQENIRRKGKNAYYYAHASSRETVKNYGGEPPRIDPTEAEDANLPRKKIKNVVKRYSWADGKKTVKIYVPTEDLLPSQEPTDDNVELEWTETSLTLQLKDMNGKDYELCLPVLHSEISNASHKCKSDSVVVTIRKVTEVSWYQLVKK
ncbi:Calcyclin-binding protein [Hondaea fermentalgiana]|uniref:Calcyclin-binding protein n=1 Tax=Hondaea fermentalgiana TaxID=2315210 RepID=A0A2R5GNC6_9STRA|nr:Calcyclin-binding protein [Hondaea fermentalgiana]|eukprot:GBG30123.1 Calcyclin-binding protein [Hondaea fermentalgiana]